MKNKIAITALLLSMTMGITGCSSAEPVIIEEGVLEEATQIYLTEAVEEKSGGSTWDVVTQTKYDFSVNMMGYHDKDNAVSIGVAGEIHYFADDARDWPQADNVSLCRFGMDMMSDGKICYTCGNGGNITKSVDGGRTFVKKTNFGLSSPNACKLISFCDENNGIVASAVNFAITADGAETWTEIVPPTNIIALRMISPDEFYCIGTDKIFYKTADGGKTWTNTPLNLPLGDGYLSEILNVVFSVDGEDAYTVICIEDENRMIKSYSTTDEWETVSENSMPEVKASMGVLYLNHDGTVLTVTDSLTKTATAVEKRG